MEDRVGMLESSPVFLKGPFTTLSNINSRHHSAYVLLITQRDRLDIKDSIAKDKLYPQKIIFYVVLHKTE